MSGGALGYAKLEIGGIQKYILDTGKLKEMIGGSEIIEGLSTGIKSAEIYAAGSGGRPGFEMSNKQMGKLFDGVLSRSGIKRIIPDSDIKRPGEDEIFITQQNAGELHVLCGSLAVAQKLVQEIGLMVLREFPGVPLFGAAVECNWLEGQESNDTRDALKKSRNDAETVIAAQRSSTGAAAGMGMLPWCATARRDGRPVADWDGSEGISLPSQTRSQARLQEQARYRLNNLLDLGEGGGEQGKRDNQDIFWPLDLTELAGDDKRIAFIHMDGNDLGKLFRSQLESNEQNEQLSAVDSLRNMKELSSLVSRAGSVAFSKAALKVFEFAKDNKLLEPKKRRNGTSDRRKLVMPLRPLVLGGDDVTVVVRADLALLFMDAFIKNFEAEASHNGRHLTMGAGMVVCAPGYPFLKAFELCETLLKNAKKLTEKMDPRPSSLDYLVLSAETESDVGAMRERTLTTPARDGSRAGLTGKPYLLDGRGLQSFVRNARDVLEKLPRSTVRPAMNACRRSMDAGNKEWQVLERNINRELGGRDDSVRMKGDEFRKIFPQDGRIQYDGFFERGSDGTWFTRLGDYLELGVLLPKPGKHGETRANYLAELEKGLTGEKAAEGNGGND
ncbi:MAG: hypothetical protein IJ228_14165 [Succinivibrio sp.]|nr:hypothetical protein [Succinivibrio sp.]